MKRILIILSVVVVVTLLLVRSASKQTQKRNAKNFGPTSAADRKVFSANPLIKKPCNLTKCEVSDAFGKAFHRLHLKEKGMLLLIYDLKSFMGPKKSLLEAQSAVALALKESGFKLPEKAKQFSIIGADVHSGAVRMRISSLATPETFEKFLSLQTEADKKELKQEVFDQYFLSATYD